MGQYDDVKIKELLNQFPRIADVLDEYQIDCLHCKKGNCRLKDIVEAENLSMSDEIEFMSKINTAIDEKN